MKGFKVFLLTISLLLITSCNDTEELLEGHWGVYQVQYKNEFILNYQEYTFYKPKSLFIDTNNNWFSLHLDDNRIKGRFFFSLKEKTASIKDASDERFNGNYKLTLSKIKSFPKNEIYDFVLESDDMFIFCNRVLIIRIG